MKEITIDGTVYVPKTEMAQVSDEGYKYCIVRTYSAGVFAGYIKERNGQEVELINARRLWKWSGAFTLSELAKNGTADKSNCKFATTISKVLLLQAIEIIETTQAAKESIQGVDDYDTN